MGSLIPPQGVYGVHQQLEHPLSECSHLSTALAGFTNRTRHCQNLFFKGTRLPTESFAIPVSFFFPPGARAAAGCARGSPSVRGFNSTQDKTRPFGQCLSVYHSGDYTVSATSGANTVRGRTPASDSASFYTPA